MTTRIRDENGVVIGWITDAPRNLYIGHCGPSKSEPMRADDAERWIKRKWAEKKSLEAK